MRLFEMQNDNYNKCIHQTDAFLSFQQTNKMIPE